MRGTPDRQLSMLSSLSTEDLIPTDHPIRRIRLVVDEIPAGMDDVFDAMYATSGRRSVPPEQLLKATVLMAMYSMRSEQTFCERLNYDMLFKWFLDLPIDDKAFDATTFTKNRQRLLDHDIPDIFFAAVVDQAKLRRYTSSDHFSVDGTLLQAWASNKSFKPDDHQGDDDGDGNGFKSRNAEVDFKGQKRSNKTHTSTTDPDAMLFRKSNNTAAERDCAKAMLARLPGKKRRRTVAADKGYDTKDFVANVRGLGFTPHVAQNVSGNRRSAIDGRTTRHRRHAVSQQIRKRVEEPFGWIKTVGAGRKLRFIGPVRNREWSKMQTATYNPIRICSLDAVNRPLIRPVPIERSAEPRFSAPC